MILSKLDGFLNYRTPPWIVIYTGKRPKKKRLGKHRQYTLIQAMRLTPRNSRYNKLVRLDYFLHPLD